MHKGNVPQNVAIIMDGNGRWAKRRNLSRIEGHKVGVESVRAALQAAGDLKLKSLTLYTFSSENWKRPKDEVSALMSLLLETIKNEIDELDEKNVRLNAIGNLDSLPLAPRLGIKRSIQRLQKNDGLTVNLALSYSGRQEIAMAMKKIASLVRKGEISVNDIDEKMIADQMQLAPEFEPDLLIRTSGENRVSNFLLWQIAYAELYFTPILWPDFRENEFYDAIESYQCRERRYGLIAEQLNSCR